MKLSTAASMIASGQSSLMYRLLRVSNEFYRASFVASAVSNGIYAVFAGGSATLDELCAKLGTGNREGLAAWLDLGVSLGELERGESGYRISGKLSRSVMDPANDGYQAFLEEIVRYHYRYVMEAPAKLRQNALFPFDDAGELIARSSRVSEPFIFEAVDDVVPARGPFDLLEVGCGSGTYIRHSCGRNPDLTVLGLELQEKVAAGARKNIRDWGLAGRVTIEHHDVRTYENTRKFDLVTLHQNIYYFTPGDRTALFRRVLGLLKAGGRILVTTVGKGGGPAMEAVNVWLSTTEGYGPLPDPEELCGQLRESGFADVRKKRLVPFESFWAFVATRPPE